MVLRFYKTNYNHIVIFLFILGAILWSPAFFSDQQYPFYLSQNPLLDFLEPIYVYSSIQVTIAFILLIIQSIVFNNIISSFDIIQQRTYVPALVYVTLMSIHPSMLQLHTILISNLLVLLFLNTLFKLYDNDSNYQFSYTLGFIIAMATLLYSYNIFLAAVIFSSYIVYRIFNWRIWLTTIIGIATPFILLFTLFFLADSMDFFILFMANQMEYLHMDVASLPYSNLSLQLITALTLLILLLRYFFYSGDKIIRIRNYSSIIIWLFLFSFVSVFLFNEHATIHLAIMFVPLTILISSTLLTIKRKIIPEILFTILLLILLWLKLQ